MPKGLFIPKNVFFALKNSCLPCLQFAKKSAALQSHDYRTGNKQKRKMQNENQPIYTPGYISLVYIIKISKEKPFCYFSQNFSQKTTF